MIDHFADGNREVCRPGLHIYTGAGPCNQQDDVARASADDRGRLRRAQVKQKQLVCLALAALACWFSSAAAVADEQQFLRVTQLKAQSSDSERQEVRKAFQNRQAIVVMTEGTVRDFGRLLGAQMTDTKAFSKTGRSPISGHSALKDGVPLALRGVAAYIDANGVTRAVQAFAPASDPGEGIYGWKQRLSDWAAKEQTRAITAVGDPAPPNPVSRSRDSRRSAEPHPQPLRSPPASEANRSGARGELAPSRSPGSVHP